MSPGKNEGSALENGNLEMDSQRDQGWEFRGQEFQEFRAGVPGTVY